MQGAWQSPLDPWPGLQLMGLCFHEHMVSRGYCESHHPESGPIKASCICESMSCWEAHFSVLDQFMQPQLSWSIFTNYYIYLAIHLYIYLPLFAYLYKYTYQNFVICDFRMCQLPGMYLPWVWQHFVWSDNCPWGVGEPCGRWGEGVADAVVIHKWGNLSGTFGA